MLFLIILYYILGSKSHCIISQVSISALNPIKTQHFLCMIAIENHLGQVRFPRCFVSQDALTALLAGEADAMWVYADQAKNYQCAEGATDTRWPTQNARGNGRISVKSM